VFHGPEGNPGWTSDHEALAPHYRVLAPSHPGFNQSQRPGWLETIGHLAHFYHWFLEAQHLEQAHVLGFSLGGWLAAEMALMCAHPLEKLRWVDAAGIKPSQGDTLDMFLSSPEQVAQLACYDPSNVSEHQQLSGDPAKPDVVQQNRKVAARLCWKPYKHNPALPAPLPRLRLPTLIVWARHDRIIPMNGGEVYHQAIPGSMLKVIGRGGHVPHLEQPQEFLKAGVAFLGS
jgi:pimeloyl-ACP methyl ester carboxylesterase